MTLTATPPARAPGEQIVFQRPAALCETPTIYCPGCTHGIAHRLVAEVIDELGIRERTICIAPVGCAVFAYDYFNLDCAVAAHGRAPAMATGLKRVQPDQVVFTYQGDGDLAAIGLAEIVHAAARGEQITVVFINNAIYGMTGGQMAPTSPVGMRTTSSPAGRDATRSGGPIRVGELLATLDGPAYVARRSLHSPAEIRRSRQALLRAFRCQLEGRGFALVELLSTCPTNWGLSPTESLRWIETHMLPVFPLGVLKDIAK
ncbi:MAG TPA: thiamine pyrophosphate-dependent enzyme [Chloroflexota bacterium]|nr:thiamine pyrophosphate-dependent enzyme [Chloroflexota bacterium]